MFCVVPACFKYEARHIPSGKIKKVNGISVGWKYTWKEKTDYSVDPSFQWKPGDYRKSWENEIRYPIEDIEIRVEDKLLRKCQWILKNLQVGDFVKCTGTRSGDWNKVEVIRLNETIFGPKYTKPEEGFIRYNSSENHICKISKIVRNGKELEIGS